MRYYWTGITEILLLGAIVAHRVSSKEQNMEVHIEVRVYNHFNDYPRIIFASNIYVMMKFKLNYYLLKKVW